MGIPFQAWHVLQLYYFRRGKFAICILYLLYIKHYLHPLCVASHLSNVYLDFICHMTDPVKKVEYSNQDAEEKTKTSEGECSSETLDKANCLRHKSILDPSDDNELESTV
jgi:hypothetical protein